MSKLKRRLHRLVRVYTCQNAALLEISCHGSFIIGTVNPDQAVSLDLYKLICGYAESSQGLNLSDQGRIDQELEVHIMSVNNPYRAT